MFRRLFLFSVCCLFGFPRLFGQSSDAFFERKLKNDPDDFVAANQFAERLMARFRATGHLDLFRRAAEVNAMSLKAMPGEENRGGLLIEASIALAAHRFEDARKIASQLVQSEPQKPAPYSLLGDAQMELGNLAEAQAAFAKLSELAEPGAALEGRLARLAWLDGKVSECRNHWESALALAQEDQKSDPHTLAWSLVQRGELAFRIGEWDEAEKHYSGALALAPNYWSATEHYAELRGAQGKDAEAVELFTKVATETGRPEIWQSLGDFHLFQRRPEEAKAAHAKALAGYQDSIKRGEILYVHHVAGFYSDSQENPKEAVRYARQDLEGRNGSAAWDALAWALYRDGDFPAALVASGKALKSGIADSHLIYHGAMINLSAGNVEAGQRLLRRCAEVNPHFNAFHVHR